MKLVGRGTFLTVEKSSDHPSKVRKRFRFPLTEETVRKLSSSHARYVSHLRSSIDVPDSPIRASKLPDGRYQVDIFQDDLTRNGCSLGSYLASEREVSLRLAAFKNALHQTLLVYARSLSLDQVKLGLESNPNNWWVKEDSKLIFFDTTPPLLMEGGKPDLDLLVMRECPTVVGRLSAWLARSWLTKSLSERLIRSYAFDWPTTIRTFLVKTIDCVPELKKDLARAAREAVGNLDIDEKELRRFQKKLSWFSVNLELVKLRIYQFFERMG